jgi:uncharacterized protein (TIRG00374 family)
MWIPSQQLRLLLFGLLVAGVLLFIAARNVEPSVLTDMLFSANWLVCVPFILSLFLHLYLKALRWGLLLGSRFPRSGSHLLSATVVGYAANLIVPHVGEISRAIFLHRKHEIPHAYTLTTIGLERGFDLLMVAGLAVIPISLAEDISESVRIGIVSLMAVGATLLIVAVGFSAAGEQLVVAAQRFLPPRVASVLSGSIRVSAEAVKNLRHRHVLLPIILLSALQWLAVVGCVYLSLAAVGVAVTPIAAFAVLGIIIAGLVLPSAPGYVGTIQFGYVLGLSLFGVAPEPAVASSLFYNLWITLPALLWAAAATTRMFPRDLQRSD